MSKVKKINIIIEQSDILGYKTMLNLKKTVTTIVLLGVLSIPASAKTSKQESEFKKWIKYNYEAEHYQQEGLQLVDPKGDAYLIRKIDTVPMKLLSSLVKSSYPQAEI